MTKTAKKNRVDLREACLSEAYSIIRKKGVEHLSMREVARRLGVSHQAPYRHFDSRDAVLSEIVARAFASFSQHLEACPKTDDPFQNLAGLGQAYLDYARSHPLEYRLMFGTPLPDPKKHPDMMAKSKYAFSLLKQTLLAMPKYQGLEDADARADLDAMFIISTLHGMVSLQESQMIETLDWSEETASRSPLHTLVRIGQLVGDKDALDHAASIKTG